MDSDSVHVRLVSSVDGPTLAESLRAPWRGCVETDADGVPEAVLNQMQPILDDGGLFVSLTTARAYGIELAPLFLKAVAEWSGIAPERAEFLELALHEAIANALLHGNLEIDNTLRDGVAGFAEYARQLTERLVTPHLAGRRIGVTATWTERDVTLSVHDSGKGYLPQPAPHPLDKRGRGLGLIERAALAVEVRDDGRTIVMRFAR